VILLAGALFTLQFVFVPYRIRGDSMLPTLCGGGRGADLVLVSRLAYLWNGPERWDVVVVERAGEDGAGGGARVKRVVGLPGERVEIVAGTVRVDGQRMDPPVHLREVFVVSKGPFGVGRVDLGADEYFLLGDNSYLSRDSRALGPVRRREISGRVDFRFFPVGRAGRVR
jgi:signal peptidase I